MFSRLRKIMHEDHGESDSGDGRDITSEDRGVGSTVHPPASNGSLLSPPVPPVESKDRNDARPAEDPGASNASNGGRKRVMGQDTMDQLVRFFGGRPKTHRPEEDDPGTAGEISAFDSVERRSRVQTRKDLMTIKAARYRMVDEPREAVNVINDEDGVDTADFPDAPMGPADVDAQMDRLNKMVESSVDGIDLLMDGLHEDPFRSSMV